MWLVFKKSGTLPDPGGWLQQPAVITDSFEIIEAAVVTLKEVRRDLIGR